MARARIDTINGIERHPQSDAYGELVCPVVLVWRAPGGSTLPHNLAGAFKHGDKVRVIDQQIIHGLRWHKVAGTVQVSPELSEERKGWLRASLLLEAGACEYGKPA